jgi:hypothetical protein
MVLMAPALPDCAGVDASLPLHEEHFSEAL